MSRTVHVSILAINTDQFPNLRLNPAQIQNEPNGNRILRRSAELKIAKQWLAIHIGCD